MVHIKKKLFLKKEINNIPYYKPYPYQTMESSVFILSTKV